MSAIEPRERRKVRTKTSAPELKRASLHRPTPLIDGSWRWRFEYRFAVPFILQTFCMAVDEFYFHRRRGLPRSERLGHPLDTMTVLACLVWLLSAAPSALSLGVYVGLSVLSCVFVTKDEQAHSKHCHSDEQWLHALLFILHPLVLLSAGLLWPAWRRQPLSFIRYTGFERKFLLGNTMLTLAFGLYQLVYWNFIWQPATSQKQAG